MLKFSNIHVLYVDCLIYILGFQRERERVNGHGETCTMGESENMRWRHTFRIVERDGGERREKL